MARAEDWSAVIRRTQSCRHSSIVSLRTWYCVWEFLSLFSFIRFIFTNVKLCSTRRRIALNWPFNRLVNLTNRTTWRLVTTSSLWFPFNSSSHKEIRWFSTIDLLGIGSTVSRRDKFIIDLTESILSDETFNDRSFHRGKFTRCTWQRGKGIWEICRVPWIVANLQLREMDHRRTVRRLFTLLSYLETPRSLGKLT